MTFFGRMTRGFETFGRAVIGTNALAHHTRTRGVCTRCEEETPWIARGQQIGLSQQE